MPCAQCGFVNAPGMKFCGECGARLTAPPKESEPAGGLRPASSEGERRQLTVMFCDLVGSTALSEQLDPEDLRDVLRTYQRCAVDAIARFDGRVWQYLGDGLLVHFGYPRAHEDDAERAVLAAFDILQGMAELNRDVQRDRGLRLSVRIGIHTGLVVVAGEMGGGQALFGVGETPNVAARVQGVAAPDTVVISDATRRLLGGSFELQSLGPRSLKGISRPVEVFRVLGTVRASTRPAEIPGDVGLTPLVGRREETASVIALWRATQAGGGRAVFISGEAGIGKSRLVHQVREVVRRDGSTWYECPCSPYQQNTSLHPFSSLLRELFGLGAAQADEPATVIGRTLEAHGLLDPERVALFARVLSIPVLDDGPRLAMSPALQRQKTFRAIVELVEAVSANHPLAMLVSDLHWADASTLELTDLLIEHASGSRLLLLMTARPEFERDWSRRERLTQLTLGRLADPDIRSMVTEIAGGRSLPSELVEDLIRKTDGVPLFVEELTKSVLESGALVPRDDHFELAAPLPRLSIPSTLHGSLAARLDRLGPSKDVAQLASTIGREFSFAVLRDLAGLEDEELNGELRRLVDAGLVYRQGEPPRAGYVFKHMLVQEVAYSSLLKTTRRRHHLEVARILREQDPSIEDLHPEVLAHHYTEGGDVEEAVAFWQRAGEFAVQRSANTEAAATLRQALELLPQLPESPERTRRELALRILVGPALIATRGYGDQEVERTYARARELAGLLGSPSETFRGLYGLLTFYIVRGRFGEVRELCEQLQEVAAKAGDRALQLVGDFSVAMDHFYEGRPGAASALFEGGVRLHDADRHRSLRFEFGFDIGIGCRRGAALTFWLLGHPDRALALSREAVELARRLNHPFTLATELGWSAVLHQYRREPEEVERQAAAARSVAVEHGFPFWVTWAGVLHGWAMSQLGDPESGIARIRENLERYLETGALLSAPYWAGLSAEAYERAGRLDKAVEAVERGLDWAEATGERCWTAELHRIRGEILFRANDLEAAEGSLQRSMKIARSQAATSLELRAATSRVRLSSGASTAQVRAELAAVCARFPEGSDSADMRDALAFLDPA